MYSLHLEATTAEEFVAKIKEAYVVLCPQVREIIIDKIPIGVGKYTGRNTQSYGDRLYQWIQETTDVGGGFSTTTARLMLEMKHSNIQSALMGLSKKGYISMVQRGTWKRVI